MKHRVKKNYFNRDTKHRAAMLTNGVRQLILHGEIKTTKAKAKEYQRLADKMISEAKKNTLAAKRQLHKFFGKRDVVNTLIERIAPLYPKRNSGFSTITPYGVRRGDNTVLVKLSLINKPEVIGSLKKPVEVKKPAPVKKATPAKKPVAKKKPAAKKAVSAKKSTKKATK